MWETGNWCEVGQVGEGEGCLRFPVVTGSSVEGCWVRGTLSSVLESGDFLVGGTAGQSCVMNGVGKWVRSLGRGVRVAACRGAGRPKAQGGVGGQVQMWRGGQRAAERARAS